MPPGHGRGRGSSRNHSKAEGDRVGIHVFCRCALPRERRLRPAGRLGVWREEVADRSPDPAVAWATRGFLQKFLVILLNRVLMCEVHRAGSLHPPTV